MQKQQEAAELAELRQRVIELEASAKISKQIEEALRASEERFQRYFELGLIGMAITLPTKGILEVNDKICEILGYERSELLQETWAEMTHPDDLSEDTAHFNRVLAGEIDGYSMDKRFIRKDGQVVYTTISVKCLRRADGPVDYFVVLLQDITERKRAEEALKKSERELRVLFAAMTEIVLVLDVEGRYINIAPTDPKNLYRPSEELLGKTLHEIFPKEDADRILQQIERALESHQTIDFEYKLNIGSREVWFDARVSPLTERTVFWIARDITERKQAEATAKRLAHEDSVLAEIGRIISSTLNIDEVYKSFAGKVRELIEFDRIAIGLTNADENTMSFPYTEGLFIPGREPGDIGPLAGSTAEKMLQTHAGMIIEMESEEEITATTPALLPDFRSGIRSALTVPLISEDQVIGTLALRSTIAGIYTERDLKLVESIGNQIAGAIANAQIYDRLRETEESLGRSEGKFRELYDSAPVGYHELDREGRIKNVNRADLEMLGYSREELIDEYVWKFNVEEEIAHREILEKLAGLRPAGPPFERTYRRKDGTTLPVLLQNLLIKDDQGRITGMRTTAQDITERKQAEEELQEATLRQREAVKAANVGLWDWDLATNKVHYSAEWKRQIGYEEHEIGDDFEEWRSRVHPDDLELTLERVQHSIAETRQDHQVEFRFRHKDGSYRWILSQASVVHDETGRPIRMLGSHVDITERKRVEEDLRESEERYRQLVELSPEAIFVHIDGRFAYTNPEAIKLFNFSCSEEAIGKSVFDSCHPDYHDLIRQRIQRMREGGKPLESIEAKYLRSDGQIIDVEAIGAPITYKGKQGILAVARDISDRKRAKESLIKSEERFRDLFDHAPVGYYELDTKGRFTNLNQTELEMMGYSFEEMIGQPVWKFNEDEETAHKRVLGKLAGVIPIPKGHEVSYRRKDGTTFLVLIEDRLLKDGAGEIIGLRGTIQDITDRKKAVEEVKLLHEQLHQAQKMEAIGTLAGGIAHDFNNILAAILGYAELASFQLEEGSKVKQHLEQSMKAAHRAKDLVQQILAFSRQGKEERKLMNIKPIVKEGLKFLRASLPSTIEIQQNIEKDLSAIEADPTQVHQVLMNLCANAAHAMDEKGGILEVSVKNLDLDRENSASVSIEPGPFVRLRVKDTGHGMPPEILKRIFDPYFTTKEVGKGTGLGLAVVHGIVKNYGGEIVVSSEVGKGSTFDIYLPRIEVLSEPSTAILAEPLSLGQHERVLFVDDEEAIVEVGLAILGHLEYEVVTRTSSIEALELFRMRAEQFDLVITDMTMPNMTGDKLAMELLRIRPEIPIILCTGFSEHITPEKAKVMGIKELVMKPFVMKELAKAIRRALEE